MSLLQLDVRRDVLAAFTSVVLPWESLGSVVEDLAFCEAQARFRDTTRSPSMDCAMSGDLASFVVDITAGPMRLLRDAVQPGETLSGLVTALMIGEVRYRRTTLLPYVESADEPVMPADLRELEKLINQQADPEGADLMFTIPLTVRADVLTAFDASLTEGETRDELICALIGLEGECREAEFVACDGLRDLSGFPMTGIDVVFDPETYEQLNQLLRPDEDPGALITALMIDAVRGKRSGPARADELVAVA